MERLTKRLLTSLLMFFATAAFGQSNRIGFRYHLTQKLVDGMIPSNKGNRLMDSVLFKEGSIFKDINGKSINISKDEDLQTDVTLCNGETFYCLINPKDGYLEIDPFTLIKNNCLDGIGTSTTINANMKNSLVILLSRPNLGSPTIPIYINYDAWVLNITTLGVKFRSSVKDSSNVKHAAVATGSNLNLGLTFGKSWGYTAFNNRTNNSYSITTSLGLGFSTIDITKEIVTRHIDSDLGSEFVLSPSINTIFARNDIGILLAIGIDMMTGKDASSWAYQHKPYFGFGIASGFKL